MSTSSPYRTRSDLITAALGKLGVAFNNQPPELEDVRYVDDEIEAICRKLEGLEIIFVPDRGQPGPSGGNIPAAWFDDLSSIIADLTSNKFGTTPDDTVKLNTRGLGTPPGSGSAAMSLKKITRGRYTGETQKAEYF